MLPAITLQLTEALPLDPAPDALRLLPDEAIEPEATFAGFLALRLDGAATAVGTGLPDAGNPLPSPEEAATLLEPAANAEADEGTAVVPPGLLPISVAPADVGPAQAALADQATSRFPGSLATEAGPTRVLPDRAVVSDVGTTVQQPHVAPGLKESVKAINTEVARVRPVIDQEQLQRSVDPQRPTPGQRGEVVHPTSTLRPPAAESGSGKSSVPEKPIIPETPPVLRQALPSGEARLSGDAIPVRDAGIQATTQLLAQPIQSPPSQPPAMAQTPATNTGGFQSLVPIDVPVRQQAWGDALGDRVLMMAGGKIQAAEIRVTPAEMGPVRVQVSVDDGNASLTFQAQHAVTREAIEQALPRLRDILAENGITLSQASVGEQETQQGQREAMASDDGTAATPSVDVPTEEDPQSAEARPQHTANGLVDTFA